MDELDIKWLNNRISMLGRKFFSVSELNILVEDVFLYIKNNGSNEELIKNLIEFMVISIVNGFSSGILTYDDYVGYVGEFKKMFSNFSDFSDDDVKKYFDKYGLNDDFISFRLYLELLECNDSLGVIIKPEELNGITVLEWLDNKIAFWKNERNVAVEANSSVINTINQELEKRKKLTREELLDILGKISPEVDFDKNKNKNSYYKKGDWEYVKELNIELDYMDYCFNRKDSELLYESREMLNQLASSSNLSDYEVYKLQRKIEIISATLLERTNNSSVDSLAKTRVLKNDNIEGNTSRVNTNNKFFGISTQKILIKLRKYMSSISKADSEISKYEEKKQLFNKAKVLEKVIPHFKKNRVLDTDSCLNTIGDNKEDVVVSVDKIKVERRIDLLYKSLAVIGGFGLGIALSSCPGIGLFRMTASGIKLTSSLYGIVKKKFPNSLFSKAGAYVTNKIDANWNNFSFHHPFIFNFINNINYKCNKFLSNKIINYFINGLASGYFIGNLWELLKSFSDFMDTVIDKFSNFEFGSTFGSSTNGVLNDEMLSNVGVNSEDISNIDNLPKVNRRPNPFKVKPEVMIDDFSSVSDAVADSVTMVGKNLFEIGDHINVEAIEYGFISPDGISAVKLNTRVAGEVIVDKFVTLSNGEVMVHLKQLSGEGYAWFKKTVLDENLLKNVCDNVGRAR